MTAAKASTDALPLSVLLSRISAAVGAVRKGDRNSQQGFSFRGIDAVVNALHPQLVAHGVIVAPVHVDYQHGSVEVGNKRTPMGHARVVVTYRFLGPAGDTFDVAAAGEAMDSGDKATAKAMSVAYRTALLQAFSLPTDEADPDHDAYERSAPDALTEAQEAVVRDYLDSAKSCDSPEVLRSMYADLGHADLPDPVKARVARAITERAAEVKAAEEAKESTE